MLEDSVTPEASFAEDSGAAGTRLAFTGNCQSMFLASAFDKIPGTRTAYFGKQGRFVPVAGHSAASYAGADLIPVLQRWKAEGHRVILCEQVWPLVAEIEGLDGEALIDAVVRFPNLEAFALWPTKKYAQRQLDRLTPSRMLRLDRAGIAASTAKCNVDMLDVYDQHFAEIIPFDTPRHPSPPILAMLAERVLAGLRDVGFVNDAGKVIDEVEQSRGLNTTFAHPIDGAIVDALELKWAHTPAYRAGSRADAALREGAKDVAREAIEQLFAEGDSDPFFVRMIKPRALDRLAALRRASKDLEGAEECRRQVIEADPYNPGWRVQYARFLTLEGRRDDAYAVLLAAQAMIPGVAELHEAVGDLGLQARDPATARASYEVALQIAPGSQSSMKKRASTHMFEALASIDGALQNIASSNWSRVSFRAQAKELQEMRARIAAIPEAWGVMMPPENG